MPSDPSDPGTGVPGENIAQDDDEDLALVNPDLLPGCSRDSWEFFPASFILKSYV